ncbi:MAG TPA: FAD-dependent oxidoreductase [Gaiellaceae bacterium]|nr:FAD-dependent oxidoreductase [Gaiellaceae bacterium]
MAAAREEVETEVVVVGAGVMGLATARALAQAGRNVVVCEQFAVGHDRGSSHGASRIVRLSYPEARWVRLAQESYPLWRGLEAEAGRPLLELHGTLDVGDWEPNRRALTACGEPSEVLDAAEIGRRFPIRIEPGASGLFQRDGGIVLADHAVAAFRDGAVAAGAVIREHTRVEAVEEAGDAVSAGDVRARVAVVTAGAWAPQLVGVDAEPTRETSSYFTADEPLPSVLDTTVAAVSGYALVAPGVGLKAGLHQTGPVVDPDGPGAPDEAVAAGTAEWIARRFPSVSGPIRTETCLYTTRTNDEFVLERRGRIVVGSPCSGHGFKFAPVIGARLAALALEAL